MHKHMATLIGNCEQCPTHWRRPTTFLLPSLQSRGAVPSTRRPFQTLRRAHRCRIAPRGWAQPAHASHAHPTGNAMPRFRRPISIRGAFSHPQAAFAYAALHASPPIGAESRHATGRNPPIIANPTPTGNALPRFRRPISKRGALFRPQGGRSHLPTPSPRLNRRARRASATCARLYLPEELAELQIAASLPAIFLLPPSRLDAAVPSSCRFGGERWPWLQRA